MFNTTNVYGWDLRGGRGYRDMESVWDVVDFDNPELGAYYKIDSDIYILEQLGDGLVFRMIVEE